MSEKKLCFGKEVEVMDEEWMTEMARHQKRPKRGVIRLKPDGWLFLGTMFDIDQKIMNFKFRPSDVVVMTLPRSGTTWTQETLWTMTHNPDLDNPLANMDIALRSPELHLDMSLGEEIINNPAYTEMREGFKKICPGRKMEDGIGVQLCEMTSDRRIIKTHLPFSLMPPDLLNIAKVVYVARNPKDVVVSNYNYHKNANYRSYSGTLEDFVHRYLNDNVLMTPHWPHISEAWEKKNHPNLHFLIYEDMKANTMAELKKLNDFIGANLTKKQLENVAKRTSFSSMQENTKFLGGAAFHKKEEFIRKGEAGGWKKHFSPQLQQQMDRWIETNAAEIGITFN